MFKILLLLLLSVPAWSFEKNNLPYMFFPMVGRVNSNMEDRYHNFLTKQTDKGDWNINTNIALALNCEELNLISKIWNKK